MGVPSRSGCGPAVIEKMAAINGITSAAAVFIRGFNEGLDSDFWFEFPLTDDLNQEICVMT